VVGRGGIGSVEEGDALGGDGELVADGLVRAGPSLKDGDGTAQVGSVWQVLEQDDVVGQVGDAEL
jgi:hypothetical protein